MFKDVKRLQLFFMQARAGITELHFLPFNPVEKRTAITYVDENGDWHRSSKGAPEQVSWFSSRISSSDSTVGG